MSFLLLVSPYLYMNSNSKRRGELYKSNANMLRQIDQLQADLQKVLKYSVGDSVGGGTIC